MGNNPSRPSSGPATGPGGELGPAGNTASSKASKERDTINSGHLHLHSGRKEPRRRDSIQALSSGKATAAPPSESHASATAHHPPYRPQPSHSRQRSRTIDSSPRGTPPYSEDMGQEQSKAQEERLSKEQPYVYNPPRPVAVPGHSNDPSNDGDSFQPSGLPTESYYSSQSQTQRPPRLPLPIEEELHTPGSPIISPLDVSTALDHDTVEGALPRKSSLLSSTTIGDDEDEDSFPHPSEIEPPVTKAIPTLIEWKEGGSKVYVTGTFARWDRKFRLHRGTDPKILSTTVQLSPGTHHLKFIVDGEMKLAGDLPTAVDYTNILVNYIEVSADETPQNDSSKPVDIVQPPHPPPGVFPPQILPPTPEVTVLPTRGSTTQTQKKPAGELLPQLVYTSEIPQYLSDMDQPEDSERYQRASKEILTTPSPPSLPLFLGKSILNATSLMKDDASVLNLPNHTILNHLATSSIRRGVLATSATTRYKRKDTSNLRFLPMTQMRKEPNIVVTGTPGVGKSSHCQRLADVSGLKHLPLSDIAKERDCHDSYDNELKTLVVDEDKLLDSIESEVKDGGYIIDWHACDLFPESWVDLVIVLRTESNHLYDRLEQRGYSGKKLEQNIDSEIMQVLLEEARESYDQKIVIELQSNVADDIDHNVDRIQSWITSWKTNQTSKSNH
ncbi:MAG: hypothetical protein M1814_002804 [Vezdaea aestivalis]|nr:MAG: hypothetical protein M1814_002804 [Vezdaea aestivalis]